jgi:hypothetical protein
MIVEIETRIESLKVGRKKSTIVVNELIEQIQNLVLKIKNQIYLTNSIANHQIVILINRRSLLHLNIYSITYESDIL